MGLVQLYHVVCDKGFANNTATCFLPCSNVVFVAVLQYDCMKLCLSAIFSKLEILYCFGKHADQKAI